MQKAVQQFVSECGRAKMYIENDMPIGVFHDFLMQIKGLMIERMVAAHDQQVKEMEEQKKICESENCPEDETSCQQEPTLNQ